MSVHEKNVIDQMNVEQFGLDLGHELVVDLFAGGGGASSGIEKALGRPVDVAVNHDPMAIEMHKANHGQTDHYCESVFSVDPIKATHNRPVGLLWASPDCFPAGTLVLTVTGYRPIEDIQEGDRVLTHRGRYRRVTSTMSATKALCKVNGQGHPGLLVTKEHPIYTRQAHNVWNNKRRAYERTLLAPRWVTVSKLRTNGAPVNGPGGDLSFWATPCDFPELPIPAISGRGMAITKSLMWLAGRYLGDGWTRLTESRAELVITCGKNEANDLREYLNQWQRIGARANHNELAWHERNTKTAYQFSTNHRGLVEWLRSQFGHGAHAKHIPSWALGMSDDLRRSLLAGYLSADSYTCTIAGSSVSDIQTVSKSLAFGTRALVESLGMTAQVHGPFKNRSDIEGRSVNARPAWKVRWRESAQRLQNVREEIHNWTRVQSVTNTDQTTTVFNLSVEEDESYIAEGVVTHNCTHHSRAKGGKPVSRKRRGLAWVVVKWARRTRPRAIMMENVAEFSEWGPLIPKTSNTGEVLTFPDGKPQLVPCPDRKGQEFRKFVSQLERLGYKVEYNEMSACDYGAPTIRKRFFLVARRDGQPIVWPQPTHGKPDSLPVRKGKLKPHRTAADIIDWSIPCPSIFDRKKPLADKTLARIAKGIQKFVIDPKDRFVLEGDSGKTASTLIQTGYGERKGQAPRVPGLHKPLGTVVAGGSKHAVVTAFLAKHYGGVVGIPATKPTGTITTVDHHSLVSCYMINLKGSDRRARPAGEPVSTICAGGTHAGVVTALLQKYTEGDYNDPITVEIEGELYLIVDIGMRMLQPNELFRAQGFDADYIFAPEVNGKPMTKRDSVRMCGNSVPPVWTQALVQANFGHESSFSRPLTAAG